MVEIDRSAIVVIPKQPFVDWLNFIEPDDLLTLENIQKEPAAYLIPECESEEQLQEFLEKYCITIFEEQLASWFTDDTLWPVDRGFEIFCRWFAVSFHAIVFDLTED